MYKSMTPEQVNRLWSAVQSWKESQGDFVSLGPDFLLRKEIAKLERELQHHLPSGEIPKVGESVYIYCDYEMGSDFPGGLYEVSEVIWNEIQGAHFIVVKDHHSAQYRWEGWLKEKQADLAKQYEKP